MSGVVAAAVALAAWLLMPVGGRDVQQVSAGTRRGRGRVPLVVLLAVGGLLVLAGLGARLLPLALIVLSLTATGLLLARSGVARQRQRRAQQEVAVGCRVLAGQLRMGSMPVRALAAAAEECPGLLAAVQSHRVGGGVADALRAAGTKRGQEGLADLATAWQLAERSGAPLASAAERVSRQLDQAAVLRRSVDAELAPARATGKLLAVLPLFGIGLGFMVGGEPDRFLLTTLVGRWCLALGVGLACVGVLWTEALAVRVERRTR